MFYFLSKRIDVLLSPFTWALVLLALAVPWRRRSLRSWKRRRVFGALALALLLVLGVEPVAQVLMRSLESGAEVTYEPSVTYDAVALLGGVTDEQIEAETGQPAYNDSVERVVMTFRLLREDRARVAIVSGAAVDPALDRLAEARVLAKQLVEWGIAEDRVIVEAKARNTRENALYIAEIVRARGYERVLVVTSAFHMPRALDTFRAVGLRVDALPVDYRVPPRSTSSDLLPRAMSFAHSAAATRELFGRLVYRAAGYGR